jgi:nitronate monooxygenase
MNALRIGDISVRIPIIQGGMGVGISLSGLASAVANEGGIGVISCAGIGMGEPDYDTNFRAANIRGLRTQIRKAKSLTKGILGLNVMMALTDHEDLIKVAVEEKIDVIFMGAGLPLNIPLILKKAGLENHTTKLVPKVSSAKAARLIFQYWSNKYNFVPDAVVVEGPLAGGHLGFKKEELAKPFTPLHTIVEETIKAVKPFEEMYNKEISVIAGGGIYTGQDMFDIMKAGAKGVKMGTRFVTTHECDAALAFKETYINCKKEDIVFIDSPVGLPGRVIRNNFVDEVKMGKTKPFKCIWRCLIPCNVKDAPYCISKALMNAAQGNMEEGFAFAGAKAYMATRIQSVKEVFEEVLAEYNNAEAAQSNSMSNPFNCEIERNQRLNHERVEGKKAS